MTKQELAAIRERYAIDYDPPSDYNRADGPPDMFRQAITDVGQLLILMDHLEVRGRLPDEPSAHRIECNYRRGPIGGEGCICLVVNKHEVYLPPQVFVGMDLAKPGSERTVFGCKHGQSETLCPHCWAPYLPENRGAEP